MTETSIKLKYKATVHRDGSQPVTFTAFGRNGWTLLQLLRAWPKGISTLERPALRWSQYVMLLRRHGVTIETTLEKHDGAFSGEHGRYRLLDRVTVEGGTLWEYLASPEGRREFPDTSFLGDMARAA